MHSLGDEGFEEAQVEVTPIVEVVDESLEKPTQRSPPMHLSLLLNAQVIIIMYCTAMLLYD